MFIVYTFLILIVVGYSFVSGQCFEFYSKLKPKASTSRNLLDSMAWPWKAIVYLLTRCVR